MTNTLSQLAPTATELIHVWDGKFAGKPDLGWGPRMRRRFGYFTPDDYYEAVVSKLVQAGCAWADIGCGRFIFPENRPLAATLAQRCSYLLGIDPDETIRANSLLTEAFQGVVEDYPGTRQFDVVSLRMVAEHITDPASATRAIARLLKPGGSVVIFTPYKWAPVSVLARVVPHWAHQPLKAVVWKTDAQDTFPVAFRLNTRKQLLEHFGAAGLRESYFSYLDDCRVFNHFRALNWLELATWKSLRAVGLRHPESCVLAVFGKPQ